MLVLNETLQKAGDGWDLRFSRVRYAPLVMVSAFFTKEANKRSFISWLIILYTYRSGKDNYANLRKIGKYSCEVIECTGRIR